METLSRRVTARRFYVLPRRAEERACSPPAGHTRLWTRFAGSRVLAGRPENAGTAQEHRETVVRPAPCVGLFADQDNVQDQRSSKPHVNLIGAMMS
jgi:hypothetical protein